MSRYQNPFEYEGASKLSEKQILDLYIEDFSYSRFINSKRNVFLIGERGTGKTMALLYHSLPVQKYRANNTGETIDLSIIPIYVPCNTPLFHRKEFELLDSLHASLVSEHFLVISIMYKLMESFSIIENIISKEEEEIIKQEIKYTLNLELLPNLPLSRSLCLAFDKSVTQVQEALNSDDGSDSLTNLFTFSSGLKPLLNSLKYSSSLKNSHFSFMLDDAQLFNEFQIRTLNSWISYRDNLFFSFKVATTRVEYPSMRTSSGGYILEGHDFTKIDMEQPYQNNISVFGKFAREVIKKRIALLADGVSLEEFFPINDGMLKDLDKAKKQAEKEADEKYPKDSKAKMDYIYKYSRAIYFRNRPSRANLPPYSGFEMLVHISTGVIRNLLDPCYHMYDMIWSEMSHKNPSGDFTIKQIPSTIQTDVIISRSEKKWEWVRNELASSIDDCSTEDAKHVYQLLDNIAILFKDRLNSLISEPRAVVFTISGLTSELQEKLDRILLIARKAQLLYIFSSSAKDSGRRENYYMPNRILWPVRGLDPIGQHARVSIQAKHLWAAAKDNVKIPFKKDEADEDEQSSFNFTE